MCIPAIVIGAAYYRGATQERRESMMAMYAANLRLIQSNMDGRFNGVEVASLRLAYDPLIDDSFDTPGYAEHYWEHMKVLDQFTQQSYLNPLLYDVIFYNARHAMLLSINDAYTLPVRYKQIDAIYAAESSLSNAQWTRWTLPSGVDSIAFVRRLPVLKANSAAGLLIYVMRGDVFSDELRQSDGVLSSLLVYSPQGELLIGSMDKAEALDLEAITPRLLQADEDGGFRTQIAGQATWALHSRSEHGFVFVSLLPAESIDGSIRQVSQMIASLVAVALLLGVLMIYLSSRYEYGPIHNLVRLGLQKDTSELASPASDEFAYIQSCWEALDKKAGALARRIERMEPTVKDVFFARLLKDDTVHPAANEADASPLRMDGNAVVMVISAKRPSEQSHFTKNDRTLVMFAAHNIAVELTQHASHFIGYALNMEEQGVVVILQFQTERGDDYILRNAEEFAQLAYERIAQYLAVQVSIGVGRVYAHLRDARVSYLEALEALAAHALDETPGVFCIERVSARVRENAGMLYPLQQERRMIEALEHSDTTGAAQALDEFQQAAKNARSLDFLIEANHMLLASMAQSFVGMGCRLSDFLEAGGGNGMFAQLHKLRAPSEIREWFLSSPIARYEAFVSARNGSSPKQAVNRICLHIRENIRMDHSLTNYADMLRMNPTYISTIFRGETGMTFIEYVHSCKVEEIKGLLLNTERRIADIAMEMGLSERSMSRIFLKVTGMTPGQYRREHGG
jgi:AraC-like DNA-binding protein